MINLTEYKPLSAEKAKPTYISSYSANEIKLFETLGYFNWKHIKPFEMYRYAAVREFMIGWQKDQADVQALRRACIALFIDRKKRLTEQFEKLIQF